MKMQLIKSAQISKCQPFIFINKIRYSQREREREREREMGDAIHLMGATNINKFLSPYTSQTNTKSKSKTRIITCSKTNMNVHSRKKQRRRRLITVSTSDGKWHGNWNSDYRVSLQDLGLQDLVEVEVDHPLVSVNLCVQKHASFGFSVDGRIITSFTRKCTNCCSPYCRQIDANFNVWILQSREENGTINALPEIGGDPSVIYIKPGNEADLDSLVQETIRLATTVKDTCSESCEKSEPTMHYIGPQNTASVHKRWGRLVELKNANL